MKKILILICPLLFTACENFPAITVGTTAEMNFDINKSDLNYEGSRLLDPSTNETFEKYKGKLNDVIVTKVTYTITKFDGPATQTASANFFVADGDGNGQQTLASFSNVNLSSALNTETDMSISSTVATQLGQYILQAPNKATVSFTGSVNEAPVKFSVKVKFYYDLKTRLIGTND